MRIFIAISIVVASVSSASAQFAMDHGNAAAAAQAASAEQATRCQGRGHRERRVRCFPASRPISPWAVGGTIKVLQRTAEEKKADEVAQAAWRERCRPTVVEDREGLRRVKYAERDCDLSRFNTAGN